MNIPTLLLNVKEIVFHRRLYEKVTMSGLLIKLKRSTFKLAKYSGKNRVIIYVMIRIHISNTSQ